MRPFFYHRVGAQVRRGVVKIGDLILGVFCAFAVKIFFVVMYGSQPSSQ